MQPEYLVAWPHSLLQSPTGVEVPDLARPCVTALDPRDERLADAKLGSNVLLHSAFGDCRENGSVPLVERIHALALPANDAERVALFSGNPVKMWFDEKGVHVKIIDPDDFYYTPPK